MTLRPTASVAPLREHEGLVREGQWIRVHPGAGAGDVVAGGRDVGVRGAAHNQLAEFGYGAADTDTNSLQRGGAGGADGHLEGELFAARATHTQGGAARGGWGLVMQEDLSATGGKVSCTPPCIFS